jgi:HEAT repeat protein
MVDFFICDGMGLLISLIIHCMLFLDYLLLIKSSGKQMEVSMSSSQTDPTKMNSLLEDIAWYGIEFMLKLPQYSQCNPNAFKELVNIGTPAVVPLINTLLYDPLYARRIKVAMALGEIGDPRAIEPLNRVIMDKDAEVVAAAQDALIKIKSLDTQTTENNNLQPTADEKQYQIEILLASLNFGEKHTCIINELGRIGDEQAIQPLMNILSDPSSSDCDSAANALGELKAVQAVPLLMPLLDEINDDHYATIPFTAIRALGMIGDPAAVPKLISIMEKKNYNFYNDSLPQDAVNALGAIKDRRAVAPLLRSLSDQHLRKDSIKALAKIGDPGAIDELLEWQKKDGIEKEERELISEALEKLGWKPTDGENAAAFWACKQEWNKCIDIGAQAVLPLLSIVPSDRTEFSTILQTIERIGPSAIDPLMACIQGGSGSEILAVMALGRLGAHHAGDALVILIEKENNELQQNKHIYGDNWESAIVGLIFESAIALNKIKDIRGVSPLIEALIECHWFWDEHLDGVSKNFYFEVKRAIKEKSFHSEEWQPITEGTQALAQNVPEAMDVLCSELKQYDFEKRYIILRLLQQLEDPRTIEPLIKILTMKHTDYFTNELTSLAAQVLGDKGDVRAVEPLMLILEKKPDFDNGEVLRSSAVQALGKIGDRRAVDALLSVRNNQQLQSKVDAALQQLGWQGSPKP